MKKIGILTHYFKSQNYGGNLQAYALAEFLNKSGFSAEQVSYDFFEKLQTSSAAKKSNIKKLFSIVKKICLYGPKRLISRSQYKKDEKNAFFERKKQAFQEFNQRIISHSKKVYTSEDIREAISDYDIFIVGSDQVWNMNWYKPEWFLSFVPSEKKKISYAASMAIDALSEEEKQIIANHLQDFDAISVRETKAIELLKDIAPMEPRCVVDPVLLLSKEDWDEVCAERVIKEKYLFCYFLGDNKKERKIAEKFAKKHKLKIVQIPKRMGADFRFGNYRFFDATPEQFISLIKYAEYVFTDSFHAVVFSHIYQKQFFVFNRDEKGSMNSRIKDITKLFDAEDRFCGEKTRENMKYINSLKPIDYNKENFELTKKKKESIDFLINSIKG